MSFPEDFQELLYSVLQGAKLRGEIETANGIDQAIKLFKENTAKKAQGFRKGAAKTNETKRLRNLETVRAFKLSLPQQERNKPVTRELVIKYVLFHATYRGRPHSTIDQRTAESHLNRYWRDV